MDMSSRPRQRISLSRMLTATILAAGIITAGTSAPADAAARGQSSAATWFSAAGGLNGVAVTSASNAWAVGASGNGLHPKPLIAHWNGTSWKQVPTSGIASGQLRAVAATSASSEWAVGGTTSGQSLIMHWNGTSWKQVPSPGAGTLTGVAGSSTSNIWAVGSESGKALILHWNGSHWKQVPVPSQHGATYLSAVAVVSARDAWIVGSTYISTFTATSLILHWNGTSWKQVPVPTSANGGKYGNGLAAVAATSATSAWAVGCTDSCPLGGTPLIERWNGTSWTQVAAPTVPYNLYDLTSVAAISSGIAWAVGGGGPATSESAATVHWNGRSWTLSHGINGAGLTAVAALSAASVWAVGGTASGRTLILHWNGTTWN
jgi:hypothetical protein